MTVKRGACGWTLSFSSAVVAAVALVFAPSASAGRDGVRVPAASEVGGRVAAVALVRCARSPSGTELRSRPVACTIFGAGGSFAGGVNLARLRWVSWGGAIAVATGIEQGFHLPLQRIKVSVTLSGVATCGGKRIYTRAQVTSGNGTTVAHPRGCPSASPPANLFGSPSGKILCATGATIGDRSILVFCQERGTKVYFGATISVTGQVRRVENNGDPGDTPIRTIPYGRTIAWDGVRCTSLTTGMRCLGTRAGHGFLINLAGVHIF